MKKPMGITNAVGDAVEAALSGRVTRRSFVRMAGGAGLSAALLPSLMKGAPPYSVGLHRDTDPYSATRQAILASGEWPPRPLAGKVVIIKPNLVTALPEALENGADTDPEVTRAVVDMALLEGAAFILIVEAGPNGANFAPTGHDQFATYDPRVRLVDLSLLPASLVPLPNGWIYKAVHAVPWVLSRDIIFINIGKLKTHSEALASLTMKNVFGIPHVQSYLSDKPTGRFAMHDRGLNQAIIDLNLLRPADFSVIDGIVGMEGLGPIFGTGITMNTAIAGRNSLAVDRVGLAVMQIPQNAVRHLNYASLLNFGPSSLSPLEVSVTVGGLPPIDHAFQLPTIPPSFDPPKITPVIFNPGVGQSVSIDVNYHTPCFRTLDVRRLNDETPDVEIIRTLISGGSRDPGTETAAWDGRADDGTLAPPGRYAVHVLTYEPTLATRHGDAISWVTVAG